MMRSTPREYRLEVSSPGIDAPLTLPRHFRKNTGRELEVYHTLEEHKSPLKGFLRNSNDAAIELAVAKKKNNRTLRIPFDKIEYAKIILKW
ncbi:MAG: hypothetical protein U5N26_07990 [Candidatus Marinimicrobia bacterium]|nr:hypothetical protein [Candidatus Neomarinimicrobiota bacterium]